jgi:hypothetical protein
MSQNYEVKLQKVRDEYYNSQKTSIVMAPETNDFDESKNALLKKLMDQE